jgi:hypothetical protein
LPNQRLRERRIEAPIAPFVGFGQRRAGDMAAQPHVIELGRLGLETDDGVAQALAEGQLGESHAPQLVLTGEALDAVIAFEAGHAAPERVHRQMIHQLREYELSFVHGRPPAAVSDSEAGGSRQPAQVDDTPPVMDYNAISTACGVRLHADSGQ